MALRLLLVDDNAHFVEAARTLLEREGMRVVAVASTSAEALRHARQLQPDVTLVDVDLGEESGLDLVVQLARAVDDGAGSVVLISSDPESDLRELVDASPAVGFLPKSQLSSRAIIRLVGEGTAEAGGDVSDDRGR
jgi:two-component system, NarL family, nitrate/nitrite response regulator NarL